MIRDSGFSLIELAVGMAVLAIMLSMGVPAFGKWLQNSQIRTATESMQAGLQLARAEAVRRNIPVRFQIVSSLTNGCAQSLSGIDWVISIDDASGACGGQLLNDGYSITDSTNNPAPRIIQRHSGQESTPNARILADQSTISFNGLGRQVSVILSGGGSTQSPPQQVAIDISNPTGGQCVAESNDTNAMRCLRLVISPGGNIRMCDPALVAGDTQACI